MLCSHDIVKSFVLPIFIIRHKTSENEGSIYSVGNSWYCLDISIQIRWSGLSVSLTILFVFIAEFVTEIWFTVNQILRDYDLSLICTSKCDDDFVQCIAACSDSDCVINCQRASVTCIEGIIDRSSSNFKKLSLSMSYWLSQWLQWLWEPNMFL